MLRNSTLHPILVIDGDLDHRRTIMATLLDQGFAVMPARVARQGIDYLLSIEPRCFTGVELCGRVSRCEPRIPMIFTGRRAGELETALLLELGADDMIVQPYGTLELVAGIRSILRGISTIPAESLSFGEIQADSENQIVLRVGDRVRLISMEFRLLLYLLRNRNQALTRRQILNSVWGCKEPGETNTLYTFVKRLRQKLQRSQASLATLSPFTAWAISS